MSRLIYYPGGFVATAAAQNIAALWDDATSTYTAYAEDGTVTESRAYTAEETALAAIATAAEQAAQGIESARTNLISLASEQSALTTQMNADLASVQSGWDALTTDERTAIMGRVIAAFGTVMDAIAGHLIVSRIIPPPS